ncbi:MAG: 30S ribosomal protein S2 [Flavobacteriaceae bacterium]|nr:30S ribosomal protein S2 [Flavobacteriaceae bacterium]
MRVTTEQLVDAGAHFGHLTHKWNPRMAPYIYKEMNGIHIIDVNKTAAKLEEASNALKNIIKSGRKVMFVATKKQAKELVSAEAKRVNMPFVTERWLGGMLTNYQTVRKSVKKMQSLDKMASDGTYANINKKERLMVERDKIKLERLLGGIADMNRLPAALVIVDISREYIAVAEAKRLGIPVIAMVDTNSDPTQVDFAIPANDDAANSIALVIQALTDAIVEGMQERKKDKDEEEGVDNTEATAEGAEATETTAEATTTE